jgi:hypothetical protein
MKVIKITYYLLTCVFLAWFVLSWLDVVIHNTAPGYEYSNLNLINLFVKGHLK